MRFLCPFCSQESPTPVDCTDDAESASCSKCHKRFQLKSFKATEISSSPYGDGFLYLIRSEKNNRPGLERFSSRRGLSLRSGHKMVAVKRGRDVLGIADQTRNHWFPVAPVRTAHPLTYSLILSLVWPISALAIIQGIRLIPEALSAAQENPLGFIGAIIICALLASAPILLWTMRTLFPYGPRRERIRGYDPRL